MIIGDPRTGLRMSSRPPKDEYLNSTVRRLTVGHHNSWFPSVPPTHKKDKRVEKVDLPHAFFSFQMCSNNVKRYESDGGMVGRSSEKVLVEFVSQHLIDLVISEPAGIAWSDRISERAARDSDETEGERRLINRSSQAIHG